MEDTIDLTLSSDGEGGPSCRRPAKRKRLQPSQQRVFFGGEVVLVEEEDGQGAAAEQRQQRRRHSSVEEEVLILEQPAAAAQGGRADDDGPLRVDEDVRLVAMEGAVSVLFGEIAAASVCAD